MLEPLCQVSSVTIPNEILIFPQALYLSFGCSEQAHSSCLNVILAYSYVTELSSDLTP